MKTSTIILILLYLFIEGCSKSNGPSYALFGTWIETGQSFTLCANPTNNSSNTCYPNGCLSITFYSNNTYTWILGNTKVTQTYIIQELGTISGQSGGGGATQVDVGGRITVNFYGTALSSSGNTPVTYGYDVQNNNTLRLVCVQPSTGCTQTINFIKS